jgi:hypothetical protein
VNAPGGGGEGGGCHALGHVMWETRHTYIYIHIYILVYIYIYYILIICMRSRIRGGVIQGEEAELIFIIY